MIIVLKQNKTRCRFRNVLFLRQLVDPVTLRYGPIRATKYPARLDVYDTYQQSRTNIILSFFTQCLHRFNAKCSRLKLRPYFQVRSICHSYSKYKVDHQKHGSLNSIPFFPVVRGVYVNKHMYIRNILYVQHACSLNVNYPEYKPFTSHIPERFVIGIVLGFDMYIKSLL